MFHILCGFFPFNWQMVDKHSQFDGLSLPIPSKKQHHGDAKLGLIHKLARPGGFRHDRLENVGWPLGRRLLVRMVVRGAATCIGTPASHGSMETQVIFILFPVGFL